MYEIAKYDELYRPYDKSGGELKRPDFVKLPVKPKGDGLQLLLEQKRGLEVFAIWCLLLEKTTAEKPPNRGKLLNHLDAPASVEEIARSISLKSRANLVGYALNLLTTIGWVIRTNNAEESSGKLPFKVSKVKVSKPKDKDKVKHLDFVFLTEVEYQKLIDRFGKEATDSLIEDLDTAIDSKGYKCTNHYKTIIAWAKRAGKSDKKKPRKPSAELIAEYERQKSEGKT